MAIAVAMPKQGNSVVECLLVDWLVQEGDRVDAGRPLCNIETDKASFEVPAPAAGIVLKLFRAAGDLVPVLTNIAAIGEIGENIDALAPDGANPHPPAPAAGEAPAVPAAATAPTPTPAVSAAPAAPGVVDGLRPPISPRAKGLAESLGVPLATLAGPGSGPGGRIVSADVRAAAEQPGVRFTPLAAARAEKDGLVAGAATGIGGRVRAGDLVAARSALIPPAAAAPAAPAAADGADGDGAFDFPDDEAPTAIPYRGIRKLIAERMRQSMRQHAQLTLQRTADASALMSLRRSLKEHGAALGLPKLTVNDLICWVVARTLPLFPEVNGTFDMAGEKLLQYRPAHLGVAVDTPRGLMVPVIPNAHRLSPAALARGVAEAAALCRSGSIDPDRLQGGTFTVSNLGALGIEFFTPILNSPQVALLGVGAITSAAVDDGKGGVVMRPRLALSLTIDHQVVDGAPGARFLAAVADGLADLSHTFALRGMR